MTQITKNNSPFTWNATQKNQDKPLEEAGLRPGVRFSGGALRACSYKTKTEASQQRRSRHTLQGVFLVFLCCIPSKWTIIFDDLSHFAIFLSLLEHETPCKCPFGHLLSHIKQQTIGSNFYQMQHTLVLIILLLQIQSKNATILYIDVGASYSSKTKSGHYHIRSESDFAVCCYVSSM